MVLARLDVVFWHRRIVLPMWSRHNPFAWSAVQRGRGYTSEPQRCWGSVGSAVNSLKELPSVLVLGEI